MNVPDLRSAPASGNAPDWDEDQPRPLGIRRVLALLLGSALGFALGTLIADLRFGLIFGSAWLVSRSAFAVHEHYQWRRRTKDAAGVFGQD
ncbi:MAG: hypothetical protein JHC84_18710 [Solirubrobacteraceae bacterium]|nr:hypothetical protein [Solirubrobacteraceae bacterium]